MRRALLIFALIIVLAGVGSFVYFRYFYNRPGLVITPAQQAGLPVAGQGSTTPLQTTASTNATQPSAGPTIVSQKLTRIASGPVVPGMVVTDNVASSTATTTATYAIASYIDRQSGNVYNYSELTGQITRISDKTIPGIERAHWLPDGSLAYVQYLSGSNMDTVNTYGLPANSSGGFFLPQDLADLAVSTTNILTLASGVNGSIATLGKTDGVALSQAFTTPLSDIRVSFAGPNAYSVFTKPSAALAGDFYLVTNKGQFSRVAGPLNGLVALTSPSGKWALVSYSADSSMKMELVNLTTGAALPLPIATIADKCVWSADSTQAYCGIPDNPPAGNYPDDWYQGLTHFSDSLWRIDIAGRYAQLVDRISQDAGTALDIQRPAIDPNSTTFVFVNKNDGSLWSYKLQ